MQFANPYMLWGLLLLIVPIIIHLFNFRRYRKVYFTNVRQLQEISIKTRRNARIKNLLVLLLRMAAIAALVLAFAGPYKSNEHQKGDMVSGNKLVSVFIDNSFSMESSIGDVALLDLAKQRAIEIADAYSVTDKFQLLTNDFSGKSQRFLSKESFVEEARNIAYSPVIRTTKEIITRQKALLSQEEGKKECYFISDFQKNTIDPASLEADSMFSITLMPLQADLRADIFVDSCWFESPVHRQGETNKLYVKLRGIGNEFLQKMPVRLMVNGKQAGLSTFDLSPNGEAIAEILFTVHEKGTCFAAVEITDYPVVFDDKLYLTFSVSEQIRIMEFNTQNRHNYLRSLFDNDEAFSFESSDMNAIDYTSIGLSNLIVLANSKEISSGLIASLEQFVSDGGSLVLFPSEEKSMVSFSELLNHFGSPFNFQPDTSALNFATLNLNSRFFDDVFERIPDNMDLPSVNFHYHTSTPIGAETIISLSNGDPALIRIPYKTGTIYLFTTPFDEKHTNLPRQALFVPVMLRMALSSVHEQALYQLIGENEFLSLRNFAMTSDVPPKVVAEDGSSFIPGVRESNGQVHLFMHDNIRNAGFYRIASATDTVSAAYNYNRKEAILEYLSTGDIEQTLRSNGLTNVSLWRKSGLSVAQGIAEMRQGVPLWRWFIIFALIALLGEGLLLRFWK